MKDDTKGEEKKDGGGKETHELESRREFLTGLGKWSKIVIGVALVGSAALSSDADARHGGGGSGGWHKGGGGWHKGDGGWHKGGGGWHKGGPWYNGWNDYGWTDNECWSDYDWSDDDDD